MEEITTKEVIKEENISSYKHNEEICSIQNNEAHVRWVEEEISEENNTSL